jgi:hypothetical protein
MINNLVYYYKSAPILDVFNFSEYRRNVIFDTVFVMILYAFQKTMLHGYQVNIYMNPLSRQLKSSYYDFS